MFIPLKDENPAFRPPIVTLVLIGVNVLLFALHALRPQGLEMAALRFGAVPYDITHFGSAAAGRVPPLLTLLTSMFQHGSVFHLGGNMLFLWIFGNNVEDFLGHARYALFYAICGLAAALTQVAAMPGSRAPMIGASGAIAGVLGAYWLLFPRARVKTFIFLIFYIDVVAIPAGVLLGAWFLLQVLNVGMGGGVAWFAHIGGFLAGLILIWMAGRKKAPKHMEVDNYH